MRTKVLEIPKNELFEKFKIFQEKDDEWQKINVKLQKYKSEIRSLAQIASEKFEDREEALKDWKIASSQFLV